MEIKREGSRLQIKNTGVTSVVPEPSLVAEMRASVLCLGPLLACLKSCEMPLPGGCLIGARPIDLHLKGLSVLGAEVRVHEGRLFATAKKGLKGAPMRFDFPTVGGTENLILAALGARGKTVLQNISIEPEIFDLIGYLKILGAQITQTGPREIQIEGGRKLEPKGPYTVIPDRIEAGTLLLAGALTSSSISIAKCRPDHLKALLNALKKCGFPTVFEKNRIILKKAKKTAGLGIETAVYPGFPTDLQSQFVVLMTQLKGVSQLREKIFEKRFRYLEALKRMSAQVEIKDHCTIQMRGPQALMGAQVQATDLRASAGLILAGLAAEGETVISDIHHLLRGYENLHLKLCSLGASVKIHPGVSQSPARNVDKLYPTL